MRKIHIIGIGMGNPETITVEGKKAIERSQAIIGAKRMVDSFSSGKQKCNYAINAARIMEWILENEEIQDISVLMSGDIGFYSGAKKISELATELFGNPFGNFTPNKGCLESINEDGREQCGEIQIEYLPGISSLSYFASKICQSWEDAKLISLHGKDDNIVANVSLNRKVFFLTDGNSNNVRSICNTLTDQGLSEVQVYVGEQLSYEEERITSGTAKELSQKDFHNLSVVMVINENTVMEETHTLGIKDECFTRGQVPMTKEEVRTVTVSKLNLKKDDVVYDIGAGTGSISVEIALTCIYGKVFAIETDEDALELIEINKNKFGAFNVEIVNGMAPEVLLDLPVPDKAFIGGSKGNLEEIIRTLIGKNPNIKLVINVVALETLTEAIECSKKFGFTEVEIVQLNVSKAKQLGKYNLMMGQNPVYIITLGM